MTDDRRVSELSPLELLEAAFAACADLGWTTGRWRVELQLEDGRVRRAVPTLVSDVPARAAVGRRQLGGRAA